MSMLSATGRPRGFAGCGGFPWGRKVFDLRPSAIIRDLDLRKPIYRQLAAYGHMGREDLGVTWEKTDRVEAIKAALED